jgi:hypothetical protein
VGAIIGLFYGCLIFFIYNHLIKSPSIKVFLLNKHHLTRIQRFSSGKINEALKRITAAQQQVRTLKTRLNLPSRQETDPAWAIQVGVARVWEILEDCKSRALRGYGELPEATKPVLDGEIQSLIDAVKEIEIVFRVKR